MSANGPLSRGLSAVPPPPDRRDAAEQSTEVSAGSLLQRIALGDERAFEMIYDEFAGRVYGLSRRIVRNPSQAEEVAQEVFLEIWRRASRFDAAKGSATSWIMTLTHARSVDRVRSVQASTDRELKNAHASHEIEIDSVVEAVEASFERKAVQKCLKGLTELQRESITLAYYSGYTYREVAQLLTTPLPTIKTRLRDGMIRLRDCLGVGA